MKTLLFTLFTLMTTIITADAATDKPSNITVSIKVPDGGWTVAIKEVRVFDGNTYVLSQLTRKPGMAIQSVRIIKDVAPIPPKGRVKHFVLGKTWKWGESTPRQQFIASKDDLPKEFIAGQRAYPIPTKK